MCIVSNVHDHARDWFPQIDPEPFQPPPFIPAKTVTVTTHPFVDLKELQRLIDEFRQMVQAAKFLDEKLGQPDCVDPDKAKLEDRIKELEKIIASPPEFVIVSGGNVEPGRYRVIDGKLYKAIE